VLIIRRTNRINTTSGIHHSYVGDRLVCRFGCSIQTCTPNGHLHTCRVTYTRCRIDTIDPPDDEHRGARNMYRIEININEKKIVRQVGYLQELNHTIKQHCCET